MATTVGQLIEQLKLHDLNETVVFQYLLNEHTDLSVEDFEARAEALDYTDFADEMSIMMKEWLAEMEQPPIQFQYCPRKVCGGFTFSEAEGQRIHFLTTLPKGFDK